VIAGFNLESAEEDPDKPYLEMVRTSVSFHAATTSLHPQCAAGKSEGARRRRERRLGNGEGAASRRIEKGGGRGWGWASTLRSEGAWVFRVVGFRGSVPQRVPSNPLPPSLPPSAAIASSLLLPPTLLFLPSKTRVRGEGARGQEGEERGAKACGHLLSGGMSKRIRQPRRLARTVPRACARAQSPHLLTVSLREGIVKD
jgi:hypothetical protein